LEAGYKSYVHPLLGVSKAFLGLRKAAGVFIFGPSKVGPNK
jgi:hypothetical protein